MLERDVEKWLGGTLRKEGFLYFKFVSPQNPGVPDRLIIAPDGWVAFAEIKADGGKVSDLQRRNIDMLKARGLQAEVVRGMEGARAFAHDLIVAHGGGGV